MPVVVDTPASPVRGSCDIEIGLLNNLGDGAMTGGERQLVDLLELCCDGARVRLRLFSLPSIARSSDTRERMSARYRGLDTLLSSRLDGLFVTGAEPSAADLRDEMFWPELSTVIDWATTGTRSTIWSCLAAHATVLHLDGIVRRPLPAKCTGVFAVNATGDHPLLAGCGSALQVCHSRWNDLDEGELAAAGYTVVTRGAMGVDCFVRACGSRFVLLQGHPEYDAGALGREAWRDLARWRADPSREPSVPANYFTPEDEAALRMYVSAGDPNLAPRAIAAPTPLGRDFALALFRNWLALLAPSAARAARAPYPEPHFKRSPISKAIEASAAPAAGIAPVSP